MDSILTTKLVKTIMADLNVYWKLLSRNSLALLLSAAALSQMGDMVMVTALLSSSKISFVSVPFILFLRAFFKAIFEPLGGVIADAFKPSLPLYYSCVLRVATSTILLCVPHGNWFIVLLLLALHFSSALLFPNAYKTKLPRLLLRYEELLPVCFLDSITWGFVPTAGVAVTTLLLQWTRWNIAAITAPIFYFLATGVVYVSSHTPKFTEEDRPAITPSDVDHEEVESKLLLKNGTDDTSEEEGAAPSPTQPLANETQYEIEAGPITWEEFLDKSKLFIMDGINCVVSNTEYLSVFCCVKAVYLIGSTFQDAILLHMAMAEDEDEKNNTSGFLLFGLMSLATGVSILLRSILTSLIVNKKWLLDSIVLGFSLSALTSGALMLAAFTSDGYRTLLLFMASILRGAAESIIYVSSTYLIYAQTDELDFTGRIFAFESAASAFSTLLSLLFIVLITSHFSLFTFGVLTFCFGSVLFFALIALRITKWKNMESEIEDF